ncbi:hypothetical protein B0T09DRAFT_335771 [Sordaria sp. MPI-SDFR-AT-0083]|nr:hypothetical protein B0T09DRAFT_335771 [Sordaria sp. MPI-SDFR-AT-0083]
MARDGTGHAFIRTSSSFVVFLPLLVTAPTFLGSVKRYLPSQIGSAPPLKKLRPIARLPGIVINLGSVGTVLVYDQHLHRNSSYSFSSPHLNTQYPNNCGES